MRWNGRNEQHSGEAIPRHHLRNEMKDEHLFTPSLGSVVDGVFLRDTQYVCTYTDAVPESDDRNKIDNNTPTHLFAELRPGNGYNPHILFTWPALVTLSSYPCFDSLYIMLLIMNPFYEGTRHGLRLVGSGEEDDLDKYRYKCKS